jgi:hypothetical protein
MSGHHDTVEAIEAFLRAHGALPPLAAASSSKNSDFRQPSGRTRATDALLVDMTATIDRFVAACFAAGRPAVAALETVLDATERYQLATNTVYQRVCHLLELAHAAMEVHSVPTGDDLQKLLFATAARPPFRALSSSAVTCIPTSIGAFCSLMTRHLALTPVGLVRLTAPYFLLTAEWRVVYSGQSGVALVLQQHFLAASDVSTLPEGPVVDIAALSPKTEMRRAQFLYAGFVVVDLALVSASNGTPDVIPM